MIQIEFSKQCATELLKLTEGFRYTDSIYFTLEELKLLPAIIKSLNYIDDLAISPFHITDISIMEPYWCILSIKIVDKVQDKFNVLLSEIGISSLEGKEDYYKNEIELWDNTYYEVLLDDVNGFIESLNQYLAFMEKQEKLLREEYDIPNQKNYGIYYQLW